MSAARPNRPRFPFAIAFSLLIAGCSGDGCSCVEPIPGGFPDEQRVDNAIQVRVSDQGIAAVEADPAGLLGGLIGGGGAPGVVEFPVPPSCGDTAVCCPGGTPSPDCGPILIDLNKQGTEADRLEINPVQGADQIDVIVRARVATAMDLPVGASGVNCLVAIDTTASGTESLTLSAQLQLLQDANAGTTRLEVASVTVTDFDDGDIDIKQGDFLCIFGGLAKGTIVDQFVGALEDGVKGAIEDQLCKECPSGDVAECGPNADTCDGNVCMTGSVCLQELGIAGRLSGPALLGSFSPGTQGAMDIYDVAGGYATSNQNGVALGILGGAMPAAADRERCGPRATAPAAVSIPESTFFQGNQRPDTSAPFHWAVGVHEHNLDMLAYAAYDGGMLCLNVGTRTVDLLTSETLAVLFPSFIDLLHGEVGQVVLGLRPQSPPVIELGLGTFTTEGDIDMPLLDITFDDLEIDFFGQVDDQFIRLMTLTADVHLPLNLDVDENGELVPVLGDVDDAFTEIRVTNSEALAESADELASKVPAVLSLALPFLADGLGSFALPELGSLKLEVSEITAVDNESFLAIFGNLVVNQAALARVGTEARLVEVSYPDDDTFRAEAFDRAARPVVELELGGEIAGGGELEWSFRIDEGLWSPYTGRRNVRLSRDSFWLQGRHRIEVRARIVGQPRTTDLTPVVLEPVIDARPPTVRFAQTASDAISVLASDSVSRRALAIEYRLAGGAWRTASGVPAHIDLEGHEAAALEVRVTDQSGNHTTTGPAVIGFHGTASGDSGCSCVAGADPGSRGGALLLLALVCLGLARRWRRAAARLALLAIAGFLPACDCGGSSQPVCAGPDGECAPGEVERGPTGRWSSIAVTADRTVVSAYDETLGDLVLIDVTAEPFTYTAVDGVPLDVPVFDPATYRGGIAGPGPNVGAWTSVALAAGKASISYHDLDGGILRFASETEAGWQSHAVDTDTGGGVVGLYTSLAYDASGVPAIAYMAYGIRDGAGGRKAQLRYARAGTAAPLADSSWTVSVVDEVAISCAGLCDAGDVCAPQSAGGEACVTPTTDCAADCADEEACLAGTCTAIVADPIAHDLPAGTGLFANLGFLPDGRAAIVYYDRVATDLVMQLDESAWTRIELDASTTSDTGMFADMAIDGSGTVHVAYQDALGDQLLYTSWAADMQRAVEVVDDGVRGGDRPHPVGAGAAVLADGTGVSIAYQDGATSDLLLSTRDQSTWTRSDLLTDVHLDGFFTTAAAVAGIRRIASYRYDRAFYPPGELVITTIP